MIPQNPRPASWFEPTFLMALEKIWEAWELGASRKERFWVYGLIMGLVLLTFLASLCIYLAVCLASSVFPNEMERRNIWLGTSLGRKQIQKAETQKQYILWMGM